MSYLGVIYYCYFHNQNERHLKTNNQPAALDKVVEQRVIFQLVTQNYLQVLTMIL